jgi:Fe-S-cluster containining protein
MEGQVYLSEEDLARIANHVHLTPAEFEERHVYRTARLMRLRKPPDRQCMFHKDNKCSIHVVKPTQCRAFPYWPEVIESEKTWDEAAKTCPGMNQGPLIQIELVKTVAREMYVAYPAMYPEIHISENVNRE